MTMKPPLPQPAPLHPERLTWAVLLGRWVDFARGAVALPKAGDAGLLRESVPDLIMLQAVWFALGQVDGLPAGERLLGLDRAAVLVERHESALRQRWGKRLPAAIGELIDDAKKRLEEADLKK